MWRKLFFVCGVSLSVHPYPNIIESININKNELRIVPHQILREAYFSKPEFWVSYDKSINLEKLDFSIATAPFVMCLMPVIWVSNQTFSIDSMDRQLYHSLQKIHQIFKLFYPSLSWSGDLIPEMLIDNRIPKTKKNKAAILFSHGLDAVCSSFLHLEKKQLLITISGCDISLSNNDMWDTMQKKCRLYAEPFGFETSFIQFNYRKILDQKRLNSLTPEIDAWWCATLGSLTHIGLSLPVAYAKNYDKIYIGASFTRDFPFAHGNHPALDNNIHCAGISARTEGAHYNRLNKIKHIVETANQRGIQKPFLRVCWGKSKDAGNCCHCEKCLRTINAIIGVHQDPQEFGFFASLDEIKYYTEDLLKRKIFTPDYYLEWSYIKEEMRQHIEAYQESLKSYVEWFLAFPLRASKKKKYAQYDKNLFLRLWDASFLESPIEACVQ